ncbi:thioredoxin domain-containing protein, partial [bacterium]
MPPARAAFRRTAMPNRLAAATSPYLRQHQDNPVDWYPWSDEAFNKARSEGKPVFLSVGYSSCHWCHVMAHESFEDAGVAEVLNRDFVSIKVDREERPDVDEAYMAFVQMSVGRGGWPMSVFMTPDRKPFFGGTYWPKDDGGGHPGFVRILEHLAKTWRERREEVEGEANRIGGELERYFASATPETVATLEPALYSIAVQSQAQDFDPERGGFGQAPKFPPHTAIDLLMSYALSEFAPDEERQASLAMAFITLEKMCLGGIHDQVGGGFHRYSTDAEWLLPHFEKMLYDNALMLGNLARATAIASEVDPGRAPLFARAAGGIVAWLQREMTSPEGLFYSALDADSLNEEGEDEEGAFYVWSAEELAKLRPEFLQAYGVRPGGNFQDEATGQATGMNILHLREDVGTQFDPELDALLNHRASRPRPGLDDKAIVAWNGLMIGALAEAGLAEPASRAAQAILSVAESAGHLPHTIFNGQPQGEAFLDDVAALADGLFKLADFYASQDNLPEAQRWNGEAERLAAIMIRDFEDPATGAFLSTSERHESLFGRTRSTFDQPIPSGNALALRVLVAIGDEARASRLVGAALGMMERVPTATEGLYAAALPLVTTQP